MKEDLSPFCSKSLFVCCFYEVYEHYVKKNNSFHYDDPLVDRREGGYHQSGDWCEISYHSHATIFKLVSIMRAFHLHSDIIKIFRFFRFFSRI